MTAARRRPTGRLVARRAPPPGVEVAVLSDGSRAGLTQAATHRVVRTVLRAEGVRNALMSVTFVSDHAMIRLNARYFRRRAVTDVIAFGMTEVTGRITGDVYVAPAQAQRSAVGNGITVREELIRLIVHGVLHAVGHDHPDGDGRMRSAMWRRQEVLVGRALRSAFA